MKADVQIIHPRSIAWVFLILCVSAFVGVKAVAVICPVLLLLILLKSFANSEKLSLYPFDATSWAVFALILFAALSLAWTPNASEAKFKLVYVTLICASTLIAARALSRDHCVSVTHNAEGVWIGTFVGLAYLFLCLTIGGTNGYLVPQSLRLLIEFDSSEVVRATAPATLLLGPALLCIFSTLKGRLGYGVAALLFVVAASTVFVSYHDTSKLALLAWGMIFGLSQLSLGLTHRLIQVIWTALCFLVIPCALAAYALDLQHASWLPNTAQQRILIWNELATATFRFPFFGHGFDSVGHLQPAIAGLSEFIAEQGKLEAPGDLPPFGATHPHNAYLQVWFELGAIGAALLLMVGLTLVSKISRLPPHQQPFIWPTAVAAMVLALSSYGLWQSWLLALLASSVLASAVAIRVSLRNDQLPT